MLFIFFLADNPLIEDFHRGHDCCSQPARNSSFWPFVCGKDLHLRSITVEIQITQLSLKTIRSCCEAGSSSNKLDVGNEFFSLFWFAFFQTLGNQVLDTLEWRIVRSLSEINFGHGKEFFSKHNFLLIRQLKYSLVSMLIKMRILISAFQQVAMLMLNLSHDFHSTPLIHLICQPVLIGEVVSIALLLLKRIFVEFTRDCLPTNIGSDGALIVDEAFDDWNDVGKLCTNINHQTTFKGEKICREYCWFVHEKPIELICLIKQFDKLLPVLFTAKGWLDVE